MNYHHDYHALILLAWVAVTEAPLACAALVAAIDAQRGVSHGACVHRRQVPAVDAEARMQLIACSPRVVPGAVTPKSFDVFVVHAFSLRFLFVLLLFQTSTSSDRC